MLYDELNFCGASLAAPRWSWSSRGLGLSPHRVPLTRPRVVCHSGRSVVLLSRFARKLNGLVNQKVPRMWSRMCPDVGSRQKSAGTWEGYTYHFHECFHYRSKTTKLGTLVC